MAFEPGKPLAWPLVHPAAVVHAAAADDYTERMQFGGTLTRVFQVARARRHRRAAASQAV